MPENNQNKPNVQNVNKGVRKRIRRKRNKFKRMFKNNFNIFLATFIVLATVIVGVSVIAVFGLNKGITKEINNSENNNESAAVSSKRVSSQSKNSNPSSSKANTPLKRQCIVSFIDDGGSDSAFKKLRPIFEEKQVPYTISIITNLSIGIITPENMAVANQLGYEFASNISNTRLFTLSQDAQDAMVKELKVSKEWIENKGYKCSALVYPSGKPTTFAQLIVKKSGYTFAFENGAKDNKIPIDTYSLKRISMGSNFDPPNDIFMDTSLLEYYQSKVDLAYNDNNWLIFTLHANDAAFKPIQQDYLRQLIDYIKARDIKILTASDAFEYFKDKK